MRCSGCGKNIPFGGEVCPHCLRDKSRDQSATVIGGLALLAGGFIGNLVGGFGGMIIGGLVLGFVAVIATASGKKHTTKAPPRVRLEPPSAPKPPEKSLPAASPDPIDRLARLDDLRTRGVITDAEHRKQRDAIIAAL
jgi:hypothetical protein